MLTSFKYFSGSPQPGLYDAEDADAENTYTGSACIGNTCTGITCIGNTCTGDACIGDIYAGNIGAIECLRIHL